MLTIALFWHRYQLSNTKVELYESEIYNKQLQFQLQHYQRISNIATINSINNLNSFNARRNNNNNTNINSINNISYNDVDQQQLVYYKLKYNPSNPNNMYNEIMLQANGNIDPNYNPYIEINNNNGNINHGVHYNNNNNNNNSHININIPNNINDHDVDDDDDQDRDHDIIMPGARVVLETPKRGNGRFGALDNLESDLEIGPFGRGDGDGVDGDGEPNRLSHYTSGGDTSTVYNYDNNNKKRWLGSGRNTYKNSSKKSSIGLSKIFGIPTNKHSRIGGEHSVYEDSSLFVDMRMISPQTTIATEFDSSRNTFNNSRDDFGNGIHGGNSLHGANSLHSRNSNRNRNGNRNGKESTPGGFGINMILKHLISKNEEKKDKKDKKLRFRENKKSEGKQGKYKIRKQNENVSEDKNYNGGGVLYERNASEAKSYNEDERGELIEKVKKQKHKQKQKQKRFKSRARPLQNRSGMKIDALAENEETDGDDDDEANIDSDSDDQVIEQMRNDIGGDIVIRSKKPTLNSDYNYNYSDNESNSNDNNRGKWYVKKNIFGLVNTFVQSPQCKLYLFFAFLSPRLLASFIEKFVFFIVNKIYI